MKIVLDILCCLFAAAAGILNLAHESMAGPIFLLASLVWVFVTIMDIVDYRNRNFFKFRDETFKDKIKRFFSL